jgi:hypothetical protein
MCSSVPSITLGYLQAFSFYTTSIRAFNSKVEILLLKTIPHRIPGPWPGVVVCDSAKWGELSITSHKFACKYVSILCKHSNYFLALMLKVELTWTTPSSPNGVILGYDVSMVMSANNISVACQKRTLNTSVLCQNLAPFTSYTVNVAAINSIGLGPASILSVTTSESYPSDPPQNLTAVPTGYVWHTFITSLSIIVFVIDKNRSTTATVFWSPPLIPNGIVRSYLISYKITNGPTTCAAPFIFEVRKLDSQCLLAFAEQLLQVCASIDPVLFS